MPWRTILPYRSHTAADRRRFMPAEGWPRRRVWIEQFEDDHRRLTVHPVWQLARTSDAFRLWAEDPQRRFQAFDMADERNGIPFALVYQFGPDDYAYDGMIIARNPEGRLRDGEHVVAMTRDHCDGVERCDYALSWIVDMLAGRDPWTFQRLPPEPQGEIPDDDDAVLGALGI